MANTQLAIFLAKRLARDWSAKPNNQHAECLSIEGVPAAMNQENLTKLWLWLSLASFAYVVGSVISIQGGVDVFGAKFFASLEKDGREILAYFAVIVGSCLSCLASAAAILHARRHGDHWHNRIPVVFLEKLDTRALESKIYQLAVVLVLVILPLAGVVKSVLVANEGRVCEQMRDPTPAISYKPGQWHMIFLPVHTNQLRLMRHETQDGKCGGSGVEIGWYTPIVFGLMPVAAFALFICWLGLIVRGPKA